MDVVWIVLGCLVGLVVLLYLVGFALPGRFRGEIEVALPHPPERVWEAIGAFRRNPMGGSMTRGFDEHRPGEPGTGQPSWVEDLGSTRIRVRTAEADRPRRLVREMEDLVVPMTARWEFRLEPDGAGTRLAIRNETEVSLGTWHAPLFRLILGLAKGADKGVRHYAARLRAGLDDPDQEPAA